MNKFHMELGLFGKDLCAEEILKATAVGLKCDSIVTHSAYLSQIVQTLSQFEVRPQLVSSISYPHGLSLPAVKLHEIIASVKNGAGAIDYPVSISAIKNKEYEYLSREIKSALAICIDHNLLFRVVLEYNLLSQEEMLAILDILAIYGIEYIINSAGITPEDTIDNVLNCEFLNSHFGGRIIANGRILSLEHIRLFDSVKPWGIRINNYSILDRILLKLGQKNASIGPKSV